MDALRVTQRVKADIPLCGSILTTV